MAVNAKKVGLFGSAGFLIAALIIVSVAISGITLPTFIPNTGTLIIKITDKPVKLENLHVTIDWVKIQDEEENWIELEIEKDLGEFDLLALQNGEMETLSKQEIEVGNYLMIKIHVSSARAVFTGDDDDNGVELNVPSDVIKVVLNPHLEIPAESSKTVIIDLQPDDLKSIAVSHSLNLRPVIKARV